MSRERPLASKREAVPVVSASPKRRMLLLVPLLLIVFSVYRMQHRHSASRIPGVGALQEHAPTSQERIELRSSYDHATAEDAYQFAETAVRKSLLPATVASVATFPSPLTNDSLAPTTVTRLYGGRYRVRSVVQWNAPGGQAVQRHFEADIQHGPTDNRFRLIDTEFLP